MQQVYIGRHLLTKCAYIRPLTCLHFWQKIMIFGQLDPEITQNQFSNLGNTLYFIINRIYSARFNRLPAFNRVCIQQAPSSGNKRNSHPCQTCQRSMCLEKACNRLPCSRRMMIMMRPLIFLHSWQKNHDFWTN